MTKISLYVKEFFVNSHADEPGQVDQAGQERWEPGGPCSQGGWGLDRGQQAGRRQG
jgi:hypothetical protein